ncbi:hypothetical protein EKO27_g11609 [Xylaria grammica]|uniref:Uncharacterized protein n=1 Tax=Xylaria grammica TaxID=363999 RepID=A0A439CMW1_9PEZI|nr:hypothetical protein EKO27_g11609 [Xylaria grammica]
MSNKTQGPRREKGVHQVTEPVDEKIPDRSAHVNALKAIFKSVKAVTGGIFYNASALGTTDECVVGQKREPRKNVLRQA